MLPRLSPEEEKNSLLDYKRCYLAAALDILFREWLGKYRNEAARRKFHRRVAEFSEAVHLSTDYARLKAILESPSEDPLSSRVSNLAGGFREDSLVAREFSKNLQRAQAEHLHYLGQMERLTSRSRESGYRFDSKVSVTSFFDPDMVEGPETQRWGVRYTDGRLVLNPALLFFSPLRRGVLAREAAFWFMPLELDHIERLYEQAEYFACRILEDKYESELWLELRHGLRRDTRVRAHDLVDFFEYYESFVGKDLYRLLWDRFDELRKIGGIKNLVSTREDYQTILTAIAAEPRVPRLSPREVHLLRLLTNNPTLPPSILSKSLGTSIITTMRAINSVTRKVCLRFATLTDMSRLGLTEWLFFFRTSNYAKLARALWRIPYCRDIYRLYGSADLFAVLDLPSERAGFATRLPNELRERGLASHALALQSLEGIFNVSLDSYSIQDRAWHVHWDSWSLALKERLTALKGGETLPIRGGSPTKFDEVDIRVLDRLYTNSRSSFANIAEVLSEDLGRRISGAFVSKKASRMLTSEVYKPIAVPSKMGTEDAVFMLIECDIGSGRAVASFLDRLPMWRGALVKGEVQALAAMVYVPPGEMEQLLNAVDSKLLRPGLVDSCQYQVVGNWASLRRWLPIDQFSPSTGWIFDEQSILASLA